MKTHLFCSFLLLWLMARGRSQAPQPEKTSRSRNNLVGILSGKVRPSISPGRPGPAYECLYVYPDLPACDFERIEEDSGDEEEPGSARDYQQPGDPGGSFRKDDHHAAGRDTRSINDATRLVPEESPGRLPFTMPSCRDRNPADKILEVRKLYSFTVKGITKPPLIFPKFDYDRWTRMIKALRNRVAANAKRNRINGENPHGTEDQSGGIKVETGNGTGEGITEESARKSSNTGDNKIPESVASLKNTESATASELERPVESSQLKPGKGKVLKTEEAARRKKTEYTRKIFGQERKAPGKHGEPRKSLPEEQNPQLGTFKTVPDFSSVSGYEKKPYALNNAYSEIIPESSFHRIPKPRRIASMKNDESTNVSNHLVDVSSRNRRAISDERPIGTARKLLEISPHASANDPNTEINNGKIGKRPSSMETNNAGTQMFQHVSTTPMLQPVTESLEEPLDQFATKKKHAKLSRKLEKRPGKQ